MQLMILSPTPSLLPPPSISIYSSWFKSEETQLLCLRVMVGVIILYDHVRPVGAFAIKATIDVSVCVCVRVRVCESVSVMMSLSQMKASIKLVKEHPKIAESLLNALRYNLHCRHSDSVGLASLSLRHTLSLSLSLPIRHTHTHTLSLSLSLLSLSNTHTHIHTHTHCRYSTKHCNDDSTPNEINDLFQ